MSGETTIRLEVAIIPIAMLSQNNEDNSSSVTNFLCIIAADNPISLKIFSKPITTSAVVINPKSSGVNNLASIIRVIN